MWFGILGTTQVRRDDGDPVAVGGPAVRSLLALLLLNAGRVVTADALIDGLYGENPPAHATNALQSRVSRLRRGLRDAETGPNGLVEPHPAGYRLAIDPDDVDAHRFTRLAREGRRALNEGDPRKAAVQLRMALDLWGGRALADVADAPFAQAQAARLEELRMAALEDHAEAELALGGHRALVPELRELVAAHPLRERPRGLLMRALYGAGRQAEALEVYEDARRILAGQLGTDPSAELAGVHLAVLRADPSLTIAGDTAPTSPPARPAGEAPGEPGATRARAPAGRHASLPAQLTSFVGRDEDLGQVGTLLAEVRLVTLLGPGGAGKTRLAVEAAGRERTSTEVCFVDLAPADTTQVPNALLDALGIRESGLLSGPSEQQPDVLDRLITALTGRRMLLVVDNCEHVIDEIAMLIHRLLAACPDLRVLATSREALGITGESHFPLSSLGLPPAGIPRTKAAGYPAIRLFIDRASAVRPDFRVDSATIDAVQGICESLDGLPLAIELAAARMRTLPVEEIAARLARRSPDGGRFSLLARGNRTAAARHQTLRAVVRWSWDLLDADEQALARRFTVFSGGATLEAVGRVCGLPEQEADALLASLTDKSLLQADGGRYRMLDTIGAYCAEQLAEAGERKALRAAHAAYFLDLAEAADPHLRGAEQLAWLDRLSAENANLLAALRGAVRSAPATAFELVGALSWYWWLRGRIEGASLAAELLAATWPEVPDGLDEEYVLCVVNALSRGTPGVPLPEQLELARSIMDTAGTPPRRPAAIVLWSLAAGPRPDAETAMRSYAEDRLGSDPWSRGIYELGMGYLSQFGGALAEAEPRFEAALAAFRAAGDRWGVANTLDPLAQLADLRGDRDRSLALLNEALTMVEELAALEDEAGLLHRRACDLVRSGDLDAAQADYARAADVARRAGASEKVGAAYQGLGAIARLRGDLGKARELHEAALTLTTAGLFTAGMSRSEIYAGLGRIAEAEGHADDARTHHHRALATALEQPNHLLAANAVEGLAGVALLEGDGERAAGLLGAATVLRGGTLHGDPDVTRVAAGARGLIGEPAFAAAYDRGAALTTDQVLALAGVTGPLS